MEENTQLKERAEAWMRENPECINMFYRFAVQACRKSQRIGAKMIAERVRWQSKVIFDGKYKWNNSYTAYVVREFIRDYPQYEKKFQFRAVKK